MATTRASRPSSRSFPVTVTQLPVVRCHACGRSLAHQKGEASQVLTAHYQRFHAGNDDD